MRVFLSGKVDNEYGSWRDVLLGTDHRWAESQSVYEPRWIKRVTLAEASNDFWDAMVLPWPVRPQIVRDLYDYVGPYRQDVTDERETKNLGVFHGVESIGAHGVMDDTAKAVVLERCLAAIASADVVFAYLNSPDAYGTLVEVGYAVGLGKFVALVVKEGVEFDWTDFWFAQEFASTTIYAHNQEWDGTGFREVPEALTLARAFDRAVLEYTARLHSAGTAEIAQSFGQISRWTSDPRVRTEAMRMARKFRGA